MDVAVIGLGLIGGSLLRALSAAGHEVTGYDASPGTRERASADGYAVLSAVSDAARADLVVLAVPLPAIPEVLGALDGYRGLLTDVTSVKGPVREAARNFRYVGGHPMAGKETSGWQASDLDLFRDCAWVLCVEDDTAEADWLTLAALVTSLGARVVPATAAEHDRAVAQISHVPHLFASALALQLDGNPLAAALAAGSFRDGTRVAATRPELTAAMCEGNAAASVEVLDGLLRVLEDMRDALKDKMPLVPQLRPAAELRRSWPPKPGESATIKAEISELLALGRAGGWITSVDGTTLSVKRPEPDR